MYRRLGKVEDLVEDVLQQWLSGQQKHVARFRSLEKVPIVICLF